VLPRRREKERKFNWRKMKANREKQHVVSEKWRELWMCGVFFFRGHEGQT